MKMGTILLDILVPIDTKKNFFKNVVFGKRKTIIFASL